MSVQARVNACSRSLRGSSASCFCASVRVCSRVRVSVNCSSGVRSSGNSYW